MSEENTRIANMMGFYSENLKNGGTRFFYQNRFTGDVQELSELEYYNRMEKVLKAADTVEMICKN